MQKTIMFVASDSTGKNHSYEIKFPNAGQLLAIEEMKAQLSKHYRDLALKRTILSDLALDIVDMQAHFSILCPKLIQEMKVALMDLDIADLLQLRSAYEKQFVPWWNEWVQLISQVPKTAEQPTESISTDSGDGGGDHKKTNINSPGAEDKQIHLG